MDKLRALLKKLAMLQARAGVAVGATARRLAGLGIRSRHTHKLLFEAYSPVTRRELIRVLAGDKVAPSKVAHFLSGLGDVIPVSLIQQAFSGESVRRMIEAHLKWRELIPANLVVNAGLNDILDKYYKGSSYTAAHYCGLTGGTPSFAAADTMASHAGWTEVTAYDEAVRQTLTWGTVSGQSVDNSASKATFTISANGTTIGGGFVTTNSTKGGSTGTLVGGAAFTAGDKSLDDNDTLNVTVTATASAS